MAKTKARERVEDGTGLIALDPWLKPYAMQLRDRFAHYKSFRAKIDETGGILGPISQGHHMFGFTRGTENGKPGVFYREWAPAAHSLRLIGDFNHWDRGANMMARDQYGVWNIFLSDEQWGDRLTHGSRVKVHVVTDAGGADRIPAYIRRVVQEQDHSFSGQFWMPPEPYKWTRAAPPLNSGLRVYETHVGMATEEQRVGTFDEFTAKVLPRIKDLGYNAIQLMAIMEHPYYGSFGYHVSNFYAVSSRFGTPEDLKKLIDTAHGMGLMVIMDLIHSHAVKNVNEGLNKFDGTDYQYFHAGPRGQHVAWDSLLFDYSKFEVQRFLLSNVRFWLEEFRFDGFRFDGITSMMYLDHGLGKTFSSYEQYFGANIDQDAVAYLQVANELAHAVNKDCITIAEDVSGMVGLARKVSEGGLGFDYRLAMGVPDYWIKIIKELKDEEWQLSDIWHTLLNRRANEKHIGYAESHDQSLVGDKTLAFWLMDKDMYWNMDNTSQSVVVDRGVALHKMIRLITFSLAGEGYLNFMGNEFGHPEWVDFPRQGNNFSYQHARRQWNLVDNAFLRYKGLNLFDHAMMDLDKTYNLLEDPFIEQLALHEDTKQLVYRRGPLVFAFNFNTHESFGDLRIPVPDATDYKLVLNTDSKQFSGPGLVTENMHYPWQNVPMYGRNQSVQIYLPSRSAQVLAPVTVKR
ncbi:MAG TPA: alpha-amylase family glycosyl hydrolase [Tepidisphaeraceae bacterium]|jgi:1,4-alpha-glucan branching enzyme|nr:alpha-amylase family glycosyl hydrolase [Tepidisphaeraceae bacterium]